MTNKIELSDFTVHNEEFYYNNQPHTITYFEMDNEKRNGIFENENTPHNLKVYYINTIAKFNRYFGKLIEDLDHQNLKVLAIDTERDIIKSKIRYPYPLSRVRVMSIASKNIVCIISFSGLTEGFGISKKNPFDIKSRYVMPKRISDLLSHKGIIKTGISLDEELIYLRGTFINEDNSELELSNTYDIQIKDQIIKRNNNPRSYKDIVKDALNIDVSKEEKLTKWGVDVLSNEQILYSALDVIYCMYLL